MDMFRYATLPNIFNGRQFGFNSKMPLNERINLKKDPNTDASSVSLSNQMNRHQDLVMMMSRKN